MCKHCPGVDCAHDRETDVWLPSSTLRRLPSPASASEAPKALGDVGGAARPVAPVLGRDGGEHV